MAERPKVPEAIRRQVRQECWFGCVICGSPIFEYDHIIEYSKVKEHTAQNLVLLCPSHHRDKTAGRLSVDRVQSGRNSPFNAQRAFTSSYKIEEDRNVSVTLGSTLMRTTFLDGNGKFCVVWNSGSIYCIIHAEDGWLSISMAVTDGVGQPVLMVDHGEVTLSTGAWDYRYEGTCIRVWSVPGELLFDADMTNKGVSIRKGAFLNKYRDGFVMENGMLLTLMEGEVVGQQMSGLIEECWGALGILNKARFPSVRPVGGFGIFCSS
ncbi:MAG: HNH endonuclease signature motif containing protein [Novosphingobium sp.]